MVISNSRDLSANMTSRAKSDSAMALFMNCYPVQTQIKKLCFFFLQKNTLQIYKVVGILLFVHEQVKYKFTTEQCNGYLKTGTTLKPKSLIWVLLCVNNVFSPTHTPSKISLTLNQASVYVYISISIYPLNKNINIDSDLTTCRIRTQPTPHIINISYHRTLKTKTIQDK